MGDRERPGYLHRCYQASLNHDEGREMLRDIARFIGRLEMPLQAGACQVYMRMQEMCDPKTEPREPKPRDLESPPLLPRIA